MTKHNDWILISKYTCQLELLANPCCRFLLRHICVSTTSTEPICVFYCIYAQWILVTVSERDGVINRLDKASTLKHLVTMACGFVLTQPLTSSSFVYPISLIEFGSTHHVFFKYFPTVSHARPGFSQKLFLKILSI